MSYRVTDEFLSKSRSKHGTRMVGSVIAEVAHHDGVGWLRQGPTKAKKPRRGEDENIASRANLSTRQVERAVDKLQELDELEVVLARDHFNPQTTFYVYRLIVGRLRLMEVDYERNGLPVPLGTFWLPEQLRLPLIERPTEAHVFPKSDPRRGDKLSPRRSGDRADDEATSATATSRQIEHERADISDASTRARQNGTGPGEPSFGPGEAAAAQLAGAFNDAAAADLEERLRGLHAGTRLRLAAHADPPRALAWLDLAALEATRNPAGFVIAGLESGEWPAPRVPVSSSRSAREAWLELTVPILHAEVAHDVVDGWDDLDPGELAQMHQAVDERLGRVDDERQRGVA